jgi:hypothetical protein
MNIERSLVLNRYFHGLFGAERFDELRRVLKEQEEGPRTEGRRADQKAQINDRIQGIAAPSLLE